MSEEYQGEKPTSLISMSLRQLIQVIIIGLVVGLLTWGLGYVLDAYVLHAILCRSSSTITQCGLAPRYAEGAASILVAGAGLFALVKLQIFRPLLAVLAATITLWGLLSTVVALPWYGVGLSYALLYAVSYAAFVWIARIRIFWVAAILMLAVVVAVRLILSS